MNQDQANNVIRSDAIFLHTPVQERQQLIPDGNTFSELRNYRSTELTDSSEEMPGNHIRIIDTKPTVIDGPDQVADIFFPREVTLDDLIAQRDPNLTKDNELVLGMTLDGFLTYILGGELSPKPMSYFIPRSWCEKDNRFIQVLPYIVFFRNGPDGIEVFVYQRGKMSGEGRLAGKCSIGVGGHVNVPDFFIESFGDSMEDRVMRVNSASTGIYTSILRELDEEVEFDMKDRDPMEVYNALGFNVASKNNMYFLDYQSSDVEQVHLAMFVAVELHSSVDVKTCDPVLHDVGFKNIKDLKDDSRLPSEMECWSRSIIDSLAMTQDFMDQFGVQNMAEEINSGRLVLADNRYEYDVTPVQSDDPTLEKAVAFKDLGDQAWKFGTLARIFSQSQKDGERNPKVLGVDDQNVMIRN